MYLESITSDDLTRMLGHPTQDQSCIIEAKTPFTAELRSALVGILDIDKVVEAWEQTGIPAMVAAMQSAPPVIRKGMQLTKPYPRGGAVTEAVMNAIEHGTSFGEQGEVTVRLRSNQKGLLLTISDPGEGFTAQALKQAKPNSETGRGNGLVQLKRCPALVAFEKEIDQFRVSLLYTLA